MANGHNYSIANSWEQLNPAYYLQLMLDIGKMCRGEITPAMVRINYGVLYRAEKNHWLFSRTTHFFRMWYLHF